MDTAVLIERPEQLIRNIFRDLDREPVGEVVIKYMTKEGFVSLSGQLPDLQIERDKNGTVTIMPPTLGGSGYRENTINRRVGNFCEKRLGGMTFSPSTGFDLPDGATKSPDVSWVSSERMAQLSPAEIEESFIPLAPDFVAEIRSKSDSLKKLQRKMRDTWIANGVRLAWLLDPFGEKAYIYRADGSEETVPGFDKELSGEDVLPGFSLALSEFKVAR